jgi:hypothetical protein
LLALAKILPADFAAPLLVVVHLAAHTPSLLPELFKAVSKLAARHPRNGELPQAGTIYVAPPGHHLLLHGNRMLVTRGAPENGFRPSIDALFRAAVRTGGPRIIGVVLTGYLNDGAAGLEWVQRIGGLTIVQDPRDAEQRAASHAHARAGGGSARLHRAASPPGGVARAPDYPGKIPDRMSFTYLKCLLKPPFGAGFRTGTRPATPRGRPAGWCASA